VDTPTEVGTIGIIQRKSEPYDGNILIRSERTKTSESSRLEKRREWLRWYRRTAKGKEATRRSSEKYHTSEKGKAANAQYAASAKGKAVRARYLASPKRKAVVARYRASPKGKEAVRRGSEKYRNSTKGKAAQKRAEEKCIASKSKNTMRRQYAKKVWQALADRYGKGTLDQIQRAIQRRLARLGPNAPGLQAQLARDENRCNRAIDAIGAEYPKKLKPARPPTRLGGKQKKR